MKQLVIVMLSSLLLSACADAHWLRRSIPTENNVSQTRQVLIQRIQNSQVKVINAGANRMFVLPADRFFAPNSTNYLPASRDTLADIAQLIRSYQKITVTVSAYTDPSQPSARAIALTQSQADNIASQLWEMGVDTRILYAKGYGHAHAITTDNSASGLAANRRIEIKLRVYP
jgi:outer membrane protein OmpA-like peptidoglycan-associated protein